MSRRFRVWPAIAALAAITVGVVVVRGEQQVGRSPNLAVATESSPSGQTAGDQMTPADGSRPGLSPGRGIGVGTGQWSVASLRDRSASGATGSVLVFLEMSEELVAMAPEDAADTQRRLATRATADEAASEIAAQVTQLHDASVGEMRLDVAPIAWATTEVVAAQEYLVTVWYVEVFSLGGEAEAYGAFKIYSAAVRWEDGGWKLSEAETLTGPQPIVLGDATSGGQLRNQLVGFSDGGLLAPAVVAVGESR